MKYDAFISYRHTALDLSVAKKLHKALETYHIPNLRGVKGSGIFNRHLFPGHTGFLLGFQGNQYLYRTP